MIVLTNGWFVCADATTAVIEQQIVVLGGRVRQQA